MSRAEYIREIKIFITVNAKRQCGIPLSRDVQFRVTHTLCTRMQAKTGLDLHAPYHVDQHCLSPSFCESQLYRCKT